MHQNKTGIMALILFFALFLQTAIYAAVEVNLLVTVPNSTPEEAKICVTGNHELLSNWSGAGVALKEIGPNLFSFTGSFPAETTIEFKFTRGNFASVEKTSQGFEVPNRKLHINGQKIVERVKVEAWADQLGNQNPSHQANITGNYKLLSNVESKFLKQKRDVIVWLPPSYEKSAGRRLRYPVIYMHDGGNLFDPGTSFGGVDWGVDEAMDEGIKKGELKETIVVAIGNTADRMGEYTPFPDPKHKGGDGENYTKFLVNELKVRIDKEFRTLSDRENTFIGGSSLGGLISLYIGVSRPQVFSGIIAMSPSIWWSNGGIIDWLLKNKLAAWKGKIWVDMGTREGEEAMQFARQLSETLKNDCSEFKGLVYREFSGGTHSEGSWKQRIHLPLRLFIGKSRR